MRLACEKELNPLSAQLHVHFKRGGEKDKIAGCCFVYLRLRGGGAWARGVWERMMLSMLGQKDGTEEEHDRAAVNTQSKREKKTKGEVRDGKNVEQMI